MKNEHVKKNTIFLFQIFLKCDHQNNDYKKNFHVEN